MALPFPPIPDTRGGDGADDPPRVPTLEASKFLRLHSPKLNDSFFDGWHPNEITYTSDFAPKNVGGGWEDALG